MSLLPAGPRARHLMASCGLAVILSALSWPAATVTPQRIDPDTLFTKWIEELDHHRPGAIDDAAAVIASWTAADLEAALRRFRVEWRGREAFNMTALRAATLHADIAMWQWDAVQGDAEPPPLPGAAATGHTVLLLLDGKYLGTDDLSLHWSLARRLIDAVRPSPADNELARLWYKATVAYLVANSSYTEALAHIARARQLFRTDAFFALADGCVSEAFASARIQEGARNAPEIPRKQPTVATAPANLDGAERAFRRAVTLDGRLMYARLRLGRVLARRGKTRDAIAQFEAVLDGTSDDSQRYYAHLFLGERLESMRRFVPARRAYERAASLFPRAQSPLLALSHLARLTGDRAAALRLTAELESLPPLASDRDDPWWWYELGVGRETDELMADLHAALEKGSR